MLSPTLQALAIEHAGRLWDATEGKQIKNPIRRFFRRRQFIKKYIR